MKILETRVYRGPNQYALWPVIRLRVDLGELEDFPTARLPGFSERLLVLLPSLRIHRCSYGTEGGFVRRMTEDEGTWLGHVLEHVALDLQVLAGTRATFGKTRSYGLPKGQYHVVYSYVEEAVGLAAGDLALRLIRHNLPAEREAYDPSPFDFQTELEKLVRTAQRHALGPSTAALVRAAEERDIPWIRLNEASLIQLGYGKYQKRVQATLTSETKHIAVEIASDKRLTHCILEQLGLPVPRQVLPAGNDYRLLVVDGRMVAAAQRLPGHVVGDGRHSVAELVEKVNQDPRRGIGHEKVLTRIVVDDQARRLLDRAGLSPVSVPAEGQAVYLRSTANLSTGGTAVDVTDAVHEDNRVMAERAVQAIGLDVAGVDVVSPDLSRSYREVGGAIVGVNAAPGIRMHVAPAEGEPRDAAGPILDMLFPRGARSRIPLAAVTGTHGTTTTTRMVGHILKLAGSRVGMATAHGVYIDGACTVEGDMTGPWSSQIVLRDPSIDAAVLETAPGGIVRAGLGWRKCNVGAVLNVAPDPLGLEDFDDLARIQQIVVEVAEDYCVLNADDERVAAMAAATPGKPIFVTLDRSNERVRQHVRAGGRALALEPGINGRLLVLYRSERQVPLLWARQIPATLEGRAHHNIQNAMFAAAVAYGLGVEVDDIRRGLRTFGEPGEPRRLREDLKLEEHGRRVPLQVQAAAAG